MGEFVSSLKKLIINIVLTFTFFEVFGQALKGYAL